VKRIKLGEFKLAVLVEGPRGFIEEGGPIVCSFCAFGELPYGVQWGGLGSEGARGFPKNNCEGRAVR
jgi:hypothetical protein